MDFTKKTEHQNYTDTIARMANSNIVILNETQWREESQSPMVVFLMYFII